jgi:leucyl aminopeptidase (aminopeptidase T)
MAARAEACKARAEAHVAALEARLQARTAAREMVKARIQVSQDVEHATAMAPTASAAARAHTTVRDYVQCLLNSGVRSVVSGS